MNSGDTKNVAVSKISQAPPAGRAPGESPRGVFKPVCVSVSKALLGGIGLLGTYIVGIYCISL